MKTTTAVAAVAALAGASNATVICKNITVPVSISARNGVFNVTNPTNNIEATNFALRLARQGHNYTAESLTGYATVSGDYEISASYCAGSKGPGKTLQILTHGIGFDKTYWNSPFNAYNYSYVNEAVDQYGYSTFAYDRLGIGNSSRGEPVNEIQLFLEVAALKYMTDELRAGTLPGVSDKFDKLVHVGHSFGSAETYSLTQMYPTISDGIVLTGFSQNLSFGSQFILGSNLAIANQVPALSSYPTGYLANYAAIGVQIDFFSPTNFDPAILPYAFATGQPVTPGELLTLGGLTGLQNQFAGPVLIVTGENDTPYCGGDCYATGNPALASIPAASAKYFMNASKFEAFIVPHAGHGLNLEYSHPTTYGTINNFLAQNGLSASA